MTNDPKNALSDIKLDAMFAAARATSEPLDADAIEPSPALLAAILRDAEALQPQPQPQRASPPRVPFWRECMDVFGGWAGVGGLVAASVTGVMIGVSPPESLSTVTALFEVVDPYVDSTSGFADLLEEG
ncbi:MAG: hypothetical protein MK098_05035 [Marinovum sp.]|nr:hypothetical protein [Marinovum sp.]